MSRDLLYANTDYTGPAILTVMIGPSLSDDPMEDRRWYQITDPRPPGDNGYVQLTRVEALRVARAILAEEGAR